MPKAGGLGQGEAKGASMFKGILLGTFSAFGLSALMLMAVSLVAPPPGGEARPVAAQPAQPVLRDQAEATPTLPEPLPERAEPAATQSASTAETQSASRVASDAVPLPAGSQFNRPREDGAVVTPDADPVTRPVAEGLVGGLQVPTAPLADTQSAARPATAELAAALSAPVAGDAPDLPVLQANEAAPRTFGEVADTQVEAPETAEKIVETEVAEAQPAARAEAGEPDDAVAETVLPGSLPAETTEPAEVETAEVAPSEVIAESAAPAPEDVVEVVEVETAPVVSGIAPTLPAESTNDVASREEAPAADETIPATANVDIAQAADAISDAPNTAQPERLAPVVAEDANEQRPIETVRLTDDANTTDATREGATAQAGIAARRIREETAPLVSQSIPGFATLRPEPEAPLPEATEFAEAETTGEMPRRLVLDSERLAEDADESADTPTDSAEASSEVNMSTSATSALVANATPFENPSQLPLLSVVLIDDPESGVDRDSLKAFDFPVTFAIDPTRADAAEVAAAYREAGHEVLLLASGLPRGGAPQDIEIAMGGARALVPQALGVLDLPDDGFAGDRDALSALLPTLAEAGMGFLAYPSGLNTGVTTALRQGVPASVLYRVLDGDEERATVIARYLDRATFEAAQDGTTIVVGRTTPDTVTALYSWRLGNRSDDVAVAPVSAVLRSISGS